MKAIKFVILVAGLIGVAAFVLPLASYDKSLETTSGTQKVELSLSGLTVVGGTDAAEQLKGKVQGDIETLDTTGDVKKFMSSLDDLLTALKLAVIGIFVPALVLLLVGGVGVARGKLERLGGVFAFVAGILGSAIGIVILGALADPKVKAGGGVAGPAAYLVVVSGIVGLVGGLLTLIKPDSGGRFA